ncbi:MAG: hypothetical protein AB7Q42_07400 [Acidimicrobiia bacterium]
MTPRRVPLRMYGSVSDAAPVEWEWVDEQLASAGTYWVVAHSPDHPHPRPVWGVWLDGSLLLSVGSPLVLRQLGADHRTTVHLDSGTDVVVVEGTCTGAAPAARLGRFLEAYDAKYTWTYTVEEYGPPTVVEPSTIMAWRSAGWAGRDGFQQVAKWVTEPAAGAAPPAP